jgi:hypothetical protein
VASSPEQPENRHEVSPYGPLAAQLGLAAVRAVDDLADEPEWRGGTQRRWLPSDHRSFDSVLEVAYLAREKAQGHLDLYTTDRYPEDGDSMSYGYNLDMFHTALPFSERARHWLIDTRYYELTGPGLYNKTPLGMIRQRKMWGFDAGRRSEKPGGELLDAWWAWRRDIFEFQEQGGIDYALASLRGIAQILVPHTPQVASYKPTQGADLQETRRVRKIQHEYGAATGAYRQQSLRRQLQ